MTRTRETANLLTALEVNGNINVVGIISATSFGGDGSNLVGSSGGASSGKSIAFSILFGS